MKKIIMRRFIIVLLAAVTYIAAFAQPVDVRLKVVDRYGNGISEVLVSGGEYDSPVIYTNSEGVATISAGKGSEVLLTVYNKLQKRVTVDSEEMTVVMDENDRLLGVGYNRFVSKSVSSSAIDGLGSESLENSTANQILEALYGKLPGLSVFQNGSGASPNNTEPTLYVRGQGSYSGNNVLILVDGIKREASSIDVAEVESVTVLKDAASLALYGIRGADGAVLITTKRGGNHDFNIKAGYRFGIDTPNVTPEMAGADEYARAINEARANDGLSAYFPSSGVSGNPTFPQVNWKDQIMRNWGFDNNLNISFDGGSKNVRYYVYADYSSNRGFFKNTKIIDGCNTQNMYDALKLRSNLDLRITPTTLVLVNLAARIEQLTQPLNGTSLESMYQAPSVGFPVMYDDVWATTTMFDNPVREILGSGKNTYFSRTLSADLAIQQDLYKITKGLEAEIRIAYDNAATMCDQKSYDSSYLIFSPVTDANGALKDYTTSLYGNDTEMDFSSWLSSQYMHVDLYGALKYKRSFNGHNVDAAFVFNRERRTLSGANNSYVHHDWILGANYDYKGRYLASIVGTYSASSRMPEGDKFRLFPAASLGWVISNENFLKDNRMVNFLKLRASYGITGMDANMDYDMDVQFNGTGNGYIFVSPTTTSGSKEGNLPSTGIQPEIDTKMDLGLEFRLFKYLSGEISVFSNSRKYLRTSAASELSQVLGIGVSDSFDGKTENKGVELSLGYSQKVRDFTFGVNGNLSFARNKITAINEEYQPYSYLYQQGNSIGRFYGLVSDGFYQASDFDADGNLLSGVVSSTYADVQPGDVKYKDLNGDGKIDNYDFTYQLKSPLPELYYGFGLTFDWKGLGLKAWFQGTGSYTVETSLDGIYQPLNGGNKNISKHYLSDYWSENHTDAKYPRLTTLENNNNYQKSDLWTTDASFLKLRELELYWNLPQKFCSSLKLDNIQLYLRGRNLFSVDNVKIFDPEAISFNYPTARTYTIGVNVTF